MSDGDQSGWRQTDDTDSEPELTDEQREQIEADPVLEVSDFIDGGDE